MYGPLIGKSASAGRQLLRVRGAGRTVGERSNGDAQGSAATAAVGPTCNGELHLVGELVGRTDHADFHRAGIGYYAVGQRHDHLRTARVGDGATRGATAVGNGGAVTQQNIRPGKIRAVEGDDNTAGAGGNGAGRDTGQGRGGVLCRQRPGGKRQKKGRMEKRQLSTAKSLHVEYPLLVLKITKYAIFRLWSIFS